MGHFKVMGLVSVQMNTQVQWWKGEEGVIVYIITHRSYLSTFIIIQFGKGKIKICEPTLSQFLCKEQTG